MNDVPAGIVFKDDKVLLVLRRFPPYAWGPPGGFTDPGEDFQSAACREVWEETGILCKTLFPFQQPLAFKEFCANLILFVCEFVEGDLRCSYESKDVAWFDLNQLPDQISPSKEVFFAAYEAYKGAQVRR